MIAEAITHLTASGRLSMPGMDTGKTQISRLAARAAPANTRELLRAAGAHRR